MPTSKSANPASCKMRKRVRLFDGRQHRASPAGFIAGHLGAGMELQQAINKFQQQTATVCAAEILASG